ncbi:DUF4228 DOMAIN PROTEIN [Salix viminalis]|uniref:DUF4228 DOMAIN PROTEIN n=1 Tax=Salix viminalis TaxID=40686 RepID=A0A9Q0QIR1_SALVM|nr:DUF4228 DOMAIN PROTEIN [Salix viminalis]
MGNYVSCTLSNPQVFKNSSRSTKSDPPIRRDQENPAAHESSGADAGSTELLHHDELGKANVYAMFPMHKKNYVVTAGDMGALFVTANSVLKRASSKGNIIRVLPEYTTEISQNMERNDVDAAPRLSLEEIEELSSPYFIHRMSISRSKKPLLETIIEEELVCSK